MSEEAKTNDRKHSAEMPVQKFAQSSDPIPHTKPPRGSKDQRSFRPSTLAEINIMKQYKPLVWNVGGKTIPIGCGVSGEDFMVIWACFFTLWSFLLAFYGLLLKAAIDTVDHHTALWTWGWMFLFFVIFMLGMVSTGQVERNRKEEEDAAIEAEAKAAADAA